jgi:hypothetical protein
MAFSPLPPGIPTEAGVSGGDSGPKAACIVGATGSAAYKTAGMGLNFGYTREPDGGYGPPVVVNASSYTGIQFWAWGGTDAGLQRVSVGIADKNETRGFGVCNQTTGTNACGAAADNINISSGWQLVQTPFSLFAENAYYGGGNEIMLDPSSLTGLTWDVALGADGGAPLPFNFCLYKVAFY